MIFQSELQAWCKKENIQLCVVFGSQATGKTHPQSDVDLAIWGPPSSDASGRLDGRRRLRWQGELEDIVGTAVSLVWVTIDLNPVLGFEIVRDGVPIYEAEPNLWAERSLQLWHAYNDSLPFRHAARESLRQFAEEVRRGT